MARDFQIDLDGLVVNGRENVGQRRRDDQPKPPLLVGLHGGGFSSAFFDLGAFSLLERAAAAGIPASAIDRPGHGNSSRLPEHGLVIRGNAEVLNAAIGRLWSRHREAIGGIVLIGHSIGSAVALHIASQHPDWPLLGVAVSGVGIEPPAGIPPYWEEHGPDVWIPVPDGGWTHLMFGMEGTYPPEAPKLVKQISLPVFSKELIEINTLWRDEVLDVCSGIQVPVHYRQGDGDVLWANGQEENDRFARAFVNSPFVDAALVANAGHCIDFHFMGAGFQQEQIDFAMICAQRHGTEAA